MTPLISCIIPVYNGERFLQEALESIQTQTHPITEILVVDDGSTDGTRALIEHYAATSTVPVRSLWQENAGPAAARNLGIQAAVGEFITFLDADDLWHPEKTARQLERFAARPELAFAVTHAQNFWMEEVSEEAERMKGQARALPIAGYVMATLMARRSLFEQIGLLDTTLKHADDTDWFLRGQAAAAISELMPDVLLYRRLHRDNCSRHNAEASRAEYLKLVHKARKLQRKEANITPAPPSLAQDTDANSGSNTAQS